jgi:glycine/sarcosine N-methyltransferase
MYQQFSRDYDRFVNWRARLAAELPFVEQQLKTVDARRIVDAACGTGRHAIALAQRGYDVVGADPSTGMIERARHNAQADGVAVRFEIAGFGELHRMVGRGFDALLCLGNSLPHATTRAALAAALDDFGACLRPGGLLLIQNRNFDAVLQRRERWMEPQSHRHNDSEWLFLRFYDFQANGALRFNLITLHRRGDEPWQQRVLSAPLWPWRQQELLEALPRAGFENVLSYGDNRGAPFGPNSSPNLILTAQRS